MTFLSKSIVTFVVLLSTSYSFGYSLKLWSPSGLNCSGGSLVLSPDSQLLSATFDGFKLDLEGHLPFQTKTKICTFGIQIDSDREVQVLLEPLKINGFVSVPKGGAAEILSLVSLEGAVGEFYRSSNRLIPGISNKFNLRPELTAQSQKWSRCSKSTRLKYAVAINITNGNSTSPAILEIEQVGNAHLNSDLVYVPKFRNCPISQTSRLDTENAPFVNIIGGSFSAFDANGVLLATGDLSEFHSKLGPKLKTDRPMEACKLDYNLAQYVCPVATRVKRGPETMIEVMDTPIPTKASYWIGHDGLLYEANIEVENYGAPIKR